MAEKLCIVVCESVRRELAVVLEAPEFVDVTMAAFPAQCDRSRGGWEDLCQIAEGRGQVRILGGCCLASVEEPPADLRHCRLQEMNHCYHLFAGQDAIQAWLKERAYIVTPGWVQGWRSYIEESGFDQATAREFFAESTNKLLMLDTGIYPEAAGQLAEFADYLDLPFEIVPVGLDFFRLLMSKTVLEWRLERERQDCLDTRAEHNRLSADRAMILDLIGEITGTLVEEQVIESITQLFFALFAPGSLTYVPVVDGLPGKAVVCPELSAVGEVDVSLLLDVQQDYAWTESGNGFVLPVRRRGETLAVIRVDDIAFPQFKDHYLNLSLGIAKVCGLAISNSRAFKQLNEVTEELRRSEARERNIADALQGAMTPSVDTDRQGYSVAAHYEPALQEAEVGGDFYDMFDLDDGRVAVAVGDVSGKGLAAAVYSSMAKYMLRAYASENPSPASLLRRLNTGLCVYFPPEMFITIFYAILDPVARLLTYGNGGHEPPLVYRHSSEAVKPLEVTGSIVGMLPGSGFGEAEIRLASGDVLAIFTDGITEARRGGEMLGEEGVMRVLKTSATENAQRIVNSLFDAAKQFADGKLHDDAAVLVLKVDAAP